MRFGKKILSLAMVFALGAAPIHASASEAMQDANYNKAMLSLTPQANNTLYLSNLESAEQLFLQLNGYENSTAMIIYARSMSNLFSGRFADAAADFELLVDDEAVNSDLTAWGLPTAHSLLCYAKAANIEQNGGILAEAAELYAQIPDLFDAQSRLAGVQQRMQATGYPTSIIVTPGSIELDVEEQAELSMEFSPSSAYIADLQWFSEDETIASVDENGLITALGEGEVRIGYGLKGSAGMSGFCDVTVKGIHATSMTLEQSQVTLSIGEDLELVPIVEPADARLTWSTSNPNVVTVENGVLHAVGEGFTNVVVMSGAITCVCSVTVMPPYKSINQYSLGYSVSRSSAYVNQTTSRSVEAKCAIDGDTTTAWNTNSRWNGEWISLTVKDDNRYKVSYLTIYNGYQRKSSTYYNNARIKTLEVYCDGNYVTTLTLSDSWGAQDHYLPEPMIGSEFKFVITGVYYGSDFSDCALSELELHD